MQIGVLIFFLAYILAHIDIHIEMYAYIGLLYTPIHYRIGQFQYTSGIIDSYTTFSGLILQNCDQCSP